MIFLGLLAILIGLIGVFTSKKKLPDDSNDPKVRISRNLRRFYYADVQSWGVLAMGVIILLIEILKRM